MRTLLLLTSLVFVLTADAQNWAVWYFSSNNVVTNFPISARQIGTNTTYATADAVVSTEEFKANMALTAPLYHAWKSQIESNELAAVQAAKQANINALLDLYDNMVAYEQFCQVSNPSAAQVAVQVRRINGTLIRLGPILKDLYQQRPE